MASKDLKSQLGQLSPLRPSGFENASLEQILSGLRERLREDVAALASVSESKNTTPGTANGESSLKLLGNSIADLAKTVSGVLGPLSRENLTGTGTSPSLSSLAGPSVAASVVEAVKGGGWTQVLTAINPIASLFAKLFGGGKAEPPPALPAFAPNAPVQIEAAVAGADAGFTDVTYGADGLPKRAPAIPVPAPAITVNVQAMDSRSFLDHSEEIARAVREAMLHTNSLNDVVGEL